MKKIIIATLIVIVCLFFIFFDIKIVNKNNLSLVSSVSICDIADKFHTDDYYLTVQFDDFVVEDYHLSYNTLTLPTTKEIYDKIDLSKEYEYEGITIEVKPYKKSDGDIDVMLKSKNTENWKISSVNMKEKVKGVADED